MLSAIIAESSNSIFPIHISLDVFVEEQFDYYSPLPSRITHMVIIDVLAVGVSQHKGEDVIQHLEKINRALKSLREDKPKK